LRSGEGFWHPIPSAGFANLPPLVFSATNHREAAYANIPENRKM